jgi:DNA-binding NarL/FixJ family response regulator
LGKAIRLRLHYVTGNYKNLPSSFNQSVMFTHRQNIDFLESEFAMLDQSVESEASLPPNLSAGFSGHVRRHLAIVDQSRLRCDCLKLALAHQPRRWRVTDMASASDLARLVQQGQEFDVILLGGSTCARIDLAEIAMLAAALPRTPILVAAECDDPERAHAILRAGAKGFLPVSHSLKVLMGALERVRVGGTYVPLALSEAVPVKAPNQIQSGPLQVLTRRQRDVMALIAVGKSNKLIADALNMSESTVKAHVKQIIRRLKVANRTQAALLATRPNLGH